MLIAEKEENKIKNINNDIQSIEEEIGVYNFIFQKIKESGVEIFFYKDQSDLVTRFQQFIDEVDQGIFLQLYIANGRYQANQFAGFLQLLENYLKNIEKIPFTYDIRKTAHGVIYSFRILDEDISINNVNEAASRFESFMQLCQNEPSKVEAIIRHLGYSEIEAINMVNKYQIDYQRLLMDYRHELEQKEIEFKQRVISLRQKIENQALEISNKSIQQFSNISDTPIFPQTNQISELFSFTNSARSVIDPLPRLSGDIYQQEKEKIIFGDIEYSLQDKLLIELFSKNCQNLEFLSLRSSLEELKDESSLKDTRKVTLQKIIGFLDKNSFVIDKEMSDMLRSYLKKLL